MKSFSPGKKKKKYNPARKLCLSDPATFTQTPVNRVQLGTHVTRRLGCSPRPPPRREPRQHVLSRSVSVPTAAASTPGKTLQTVRRHACVCVRVSRSGIGLGRPALSHTAQSRQESCPGLQDAPLRRGRRSSLHDRFQPGAPARPPGAVPDSGPGTLVLHSQNFCLHQFPWGLGCPLPASPAGSSTCEPVTAVTSEL